MRGRRGLLKVFGGIPVQICQFLQMLTVRHYLTYNPNLDASRELLELVNRITRMDKENFVREFGEWYDRHKQEETHR